MNRLAAESSPYLRQHADNPVDWYPWGDEALARARAEDRPILLSIGYAACHWCHVMAHESFEDAETAALMNAGFVNVKVDREERPDVDAIYMQAVQAMTGHGGWPMTVFLTPDGEPFFGGTYFPPEDRHGLPSFRRVLGSVADAWRDRRDHVGETVASLRELYQRQLAPPGAGGPVTAETLARGAASIVAQHDPVHGGLGRAPKFPAAMALDFLLAHAARTGDARAREVALSSFVAMARGGIHDQVGGGFHRYSVDARWLVPHFEKMLYDNALLARLGVHLWQATGDAEVRAVTERVISWLAREMTGAHGGFFSTLDADSEGEEGRFYVWDAAELDALLGDDAPVLRELWGVTAAGNFEGRSILHVARDPQIVADRHGLTVEALDAIVARARAALYDVRARRVWPGRDEKVLAGWNGLMLRAVALAAAAFDRDDWRELAVRNGAFLQAHLVREGGRVLRVHAEGTSKIGGFLEDHAGVALGFLALHELTLERRWLDLAVEIAGATVRWFWDDEAGQFFDTAADAERLITRPREVTDNAVPAGNSLAAELLLRVGDVLHDEPLLRRGRRAVETLAEPMARYGQAFGHLLGAADLHVHGAVQLALVGDPAADDTRALHRAAFAAHVPSLVVAGGLPEWSAGIALLADRPLQGGRATAYVCRGYVCELPVTDPAALDARLRAGAGSR